MSTEALARHKKVRAGHRSSATRLMNQVDEASAVEGGPAIEKLLQWKLSLNEKLTKLQTLDEEILMLVEDGAIEDEIEQADVFRERLQQTICGVEHLISSKPSSTVTGRHTPPESTTATSETRTVIPAPLSTLSHATDSKVKLPKLTPKTFNGDLTKWETFWSTYESSIHLNSTLSAADKFTYLHSLLEGPAMRAVAGLKPTAPNYKEAIDILHRRFGDKQQIISRHMDALLGLESVTSASHVKALRRLYDQLEFQVRSLKSLEVPVDSYGNLLSSLLMNRLPQELRLIVSREIGGGEWKINQLMTILEREISARERASIIDIVPNGPPVQTTAAFIAGDGQRKCVFCRQGHSSSSCNTISDVTQRKAILKRTGRCFVCLRRHHLSKDCRSSVKCAQCGGRHHTSICKGSTVGSKSHPRSDQQNHTSTEHNAPTVPQLPPPSLQVAQTTQLPPPSRQASQLPPLGQPLTPTTTQLYCVNSTVPVLLQTAKAYIHKLDDPKCGMKIRLMLDGGSQRSYISQKVKDALGLLPDHVEQVQIKTFGSDVTTRHTVEMVKVGIPLRSGNTIHLMLSTVPLICEPLSCQPIAYTKEKYKHLADLDLADFSRVGDELQIDVLIGSDHYWQLVTGQVIHGQSGPTAIDTHLGWVLSGPVCRHANSQGHYPAHSLLVHTSDESLMDNVLKKFWELESLGILPAEPPVYYTFKQSIKFDDGRYEVRLPWRSEETRPPSNFQLAKRRLQGLLKRLRHHPEVLQEYNAIIQEQLTLGIVEKVSDDSSEARDDIHYLPHHAVIRTDKQTTKIRIVYDASARDKGISLNDCLLSGPKFEQNILDILLRFRTYRIALIADVEKAFLMIAVSKDDRNSLRFLWIDDVEKPQPELQQMRFTRVVFGVSASPFLLNATISHHLDKYHNDHPELVNTLKRSIYVDDVTYGADQDDDAYKLYTMSKKVFADGGFNLRKFVTNSPTLRKRISEEQRLPADDEVNRSIMEEDETYTSNLLTGSKPDGQKVLGVSWDPTNDVLLFDIRAIVNSLHTLEPTKRNIVGVASRFYDPLGFLSPVIIMLKVFFQELCKVKLDWDDQLPSVLLSKWKELLSRFKGTVITLPRCYFASEDKQDSYALYGFCDASTAAYAAVVYLRTGVESTCFIASKTRVSPLNQQTTPRLELLSCLLLAKLISHVLEALKTVINVQIGSCFTDSKVALYWITGEGKQWKQFVHNRVTDIRRLVAVQHWSHCAGKDNPADMPSRGISPKQLEMSLMWRHGPDWLPKFSPAERTEEEPMPEDCTTEMKNTSSHTLLAATENPTVGLLIDCARHSKLQKLLRVTALMQKFVRRFKMFVARGKESIDWTVTAMDIETAEMNWVTDCQKQLTSDPKFELWKTQLDLFCDQHNVWRCGGRLKKANLPYAQTHPILLHKEHPLTVLIVKHAHERTLHGGIKDTLTEVRSKYWLVKGRQFVRRIIHDCVICRKVEGPHFRAVSPPPLPAFRVNEAPPFVYCGVDFAGPLYIKEDHESENTKVWITLFTCCVTRAVHLELVPNMSTQTFLSSFKRFTSRRGVPAQVVSDNAKTFISAAQTLQDLLRSQEVQQYFSGMNIQWIFNLEKAPWWGGFFERLVQSVKRCLKKSIGRARLSYDELSTLLVEIESIINSRPLSYLSSEDLEEPLTPSHLLTGCRILSLPNVTEAVDSTDELFVVDSHDLNARVQHLTSVLEDYWIRWREEYLLQLRERYSTVDSVGVARSPVPGEVIIVHDENHPRSFWKLGRVTDIIKGDDGHVRGAVIDIVTNGKHQTL